MDPKELEGKVLVIGETLKDLAESEENRDKQLKDLTPILENLGAKLEAKIAQSTPAGSLEETPNGGKGTTVPNTAEETSNTSFNQLKEAAELVKLPSSVFFAVNKQDVPSGHRQTASVISR